MIDNYHIEEMVLQSQQVVVYRMVDDAGREYALSRFILPKDVLIALNDGRFPQCLKELMSVSHGCLRPVIDGGLDPVDRSPWLATYWWDGKTLEERIQDKELTHEDVHRVEEHAKSVMAGIGQFASFLNFDPGKIVAVQGATGDIVETFTIDLYQWFLSWATGRPPAPDKEPNRQLRGLLSSIRKNVSTISPRASSPMLPPRKTTSLHSNTIPLATSPHVGTPSGPMTTVGLATAAPPSQGQRAVAGQIHGSMPRNSSDPLAAYRKTMSSGQKAGMVAAILFVGLAVGGIGWFILNENSNKPKVAQVFSEEEAGTAAAVAPERTRASMMEALREETRKNREKARLEAEAKAAALGQAPPPKAIVIEEGDGERIEGDPESDPVPAQAVAEVVPSQAVGQPVFEFPAERPSLGDMVELYADQNINLSALEGRWVILTGVVQVSQAKSFTLVGPDSLGVSLGAGAGITVGAGDRVEVIGWIHSVAGKTGIWMQRSADLDILEKAPENAGENSVYGVTDRAQLRNLEGSQVTVVARVVALSGDDGDIGRLTLVFDEENNGFAASIEMSEREDDINLAYLEQFVGEQIKVNGIVLLDRSNPELLIEVKRKDQISRADG